MRWTIGHCLSNQIIWKDLSTSSEFCFDASGISPNDLCFILTSDDQWLLAVLNSPFMWYYLYRVTIYALNETLRLKNFYMELLPPLRATHLADVRAGQGVVSGDPGLRPAPPRLRS